MKDYKVIKVKIKVFSSVKIDELIEDAINKHSRSGWSFEQLTMGQHGIFVVLSKPKMM